MSGKLKVLENSFLYTFSSILVKAIGFLLLPVYTYFLTPIDYGVTTLITAFNSVATFIVAFSLYHAVIRFYVDYKEDHNQLKRLFGTLISFTFLSAIVFFFISITINQLLVELFFKDISFYPYVLVGLLTLVFISIHTMHQKILKAMQLGRKLTIINLIYTFLQVGMNLIFIGIFHLGALGVLIASLIANIGYSIFMVLDLRNKDLIHFCIDLKILKQTLKYSIPLLPHNLSTNIASLFSKIFLNNFNTLAVVGVYSIALQFSGLIDTIQSSVNQAFMPWFFEKMKRISSDDRIDMLSLSKFLLILYSLLYMAVGLFSQETIIIMTSERFISAWTVIPILIIAFSIKSIYYFFINILFYYPDAARKIFVASIIGSIADILFSLILVPRYGMYGAAIGFLIAKILLVSIVVTISQKYNNVGYKVLDMVVIIVPSLMFMFVGLYFSYTVFINEFNWLNFVFKIFIFLSYITFLFFSYKNQVLKVIKSGLLEKTFNKAIFVRK